MTLHLKAETEDAGTRLDAFVASRANGLTRSQAARYIEEGRVSVDGKPAAKSCRIGGGETVTVDVPEVRETHRSAASVKRDTDQLSAGSATPIMWWGTPSISAGVGAAVPMAMPR